MPKKGGGGGRRKQGIVSWITSLFAMLIGLWPVWNNVVEILTGRRSLGAAAGELNEFYNPLAGNKDLLRIGYGSLIGGIIFKIASSELTKRAKVTSIIPALHA